jgi:hypothetical protein
MEESIISLQVGATGAITRGLRERVARVIEGGLSDAEVGKHQRARPGAPNSQAAVLVPPRPPAADVVIETTLIFPRFGGLPTVSLRGVHHGQVQDLEKIYA